MMCNETGLFQRKRYIPNSENIAFGGLPWCLEISIRTNIESMSKLY